MKTPGVGFTKKFRTELFLTSINLVFKKPTPGCGKNIFWIIIGEFVHKIYKLFIWEGSNVSHSEAGSDDM